LCTTTSPGWKIGAELRDAVRHRMQAGTNNSRVHLDLADHAHFAVEQQA
jgi:hypothetical protein